MSLWQPQAKSHRFMAIIKALLLVAGFLSFILGTIGIFLPILPTTPFYLLSAFCFAKSSERFHGWFTGTKLYKRHLDSFVKNRSMTMRTKLSCLVPVSIMLIGVCIAVNILAIRIAVAVLLLVKFWYFIFRIKNKSCYYNS